ncbi:MAG: class I SAM-dependent methyltransferase, partial [Alphaproteobacteria bacterium]|nr:class I SAM-dependent methyltransferase [Alphaproteobacteria bacterium]
FCREEYGLNVRTALLEPPVFEEGSFDFIRLNHVLEHLNDPVKYLAMIARWLKPGGVFYVEVPDIEAYCRSKSKGGMFHYGHIYNFSPWTLRAAAWLAGLQEYAPTAQRCANSTGVFFIHAEEGQAPRTENTDHARMLEELLRVHAQGGSAQPRAAKMLRKFAVRVDEFFNIAGGKSYSDIGNAVARKLSLPAA